MSTASDFLRRAAGGVTSTFTQASTTVSHAAQGRKSYDASGEAMEKCTLTIKCTPNKDARTTTALAVKSGYLMKRNEQGQWQRRYICTVPHLFLYYFDSDTSESPRGVIDLELFNNISRNKNFLKVAPLHEDKMRSFHFQCDNVDTLNDWQSHFMRDRYFAVCDERNAYQQMQSEMTAVLDTIACQTKAVEIDKDLLQKQLEEALAAKQQAMQVLQSMLVIMGLTEEESAQLQDLNRIAYCLETHVIQMKRDLEMKLLGPDETLEAEKEARREEVSALQEARELEIRARKNVEAMMLKVKKAAELREQELQSEIDTLQLNFQVLLAEKAETDTKAAQLSEQKKMLVKECKRLRAQMGETETNLERVEGVNAKLTESVVALQALLKTKEQAISGLQQAAVEAESRYQQREQAAVSAAVVTALDALAASAQSQGDNNTEEIPVKTLDASLLKVATDSADSADTLPTAAASSSGDQEVSSPEHFAALAVDTVPEQAASSMGVDSEQDDTAGTDSTQVTAEGAAATEGPTATTTLSTEQVQSILAESQAIMSSLRPLPHPSPPVSGRSLSGQSLSGVETPRKGGTLSAHSSSGNLAGGRDRHNSTDSGKSGGSGGVNHGPASPHNLKELGWLSPEQERLVEARLQQSSTQDARYKYLGTSNSTGVAAPGAEAGTEVGAEEGSSEAAEGSVGSTAAEEEEGDGEGFTAAAASAASAAAKSSLSMLTGAMSLLSSTATSLQSGVSGGDAASSSGSGVGAESSKRATKGIISSLLQSDASGSAGDPDGEPQPEPDDPERLPSAMRLTCLRCQGTVEGPKYSTCSCSVPALTPEDLQSSSTGASGNSSGSSGSWGFTGMFSKSSSVFKDSLAKASKVTASNVGSFMQMTKAAASSAAGSGTGAGAGVGASAQEGEGANVKQKEGFLFYSTVVSAPAPAAAAAVGSGVSATAPGPDGSAENKVAPEKELWGLFTGTQPPLQTETGGTEDVDKGTAEVSLPTAQTEDGSVAPLDAVEDKPPDAEGENDVSL